MRKRIMLIVGCSVAALFLVLPAFAAESYPADRWGCSKGCVVYQNEEGDRCVFDAADLRKLYQISQ